MIKLYDENAYTDEFSAVVTECVKGKGGYRVLLNQTAFFPEAGGQDCDTGILAGQRVERVESEGDKVYHYLKNPIDAGCRVNGKIDWDIRFRKMQHHSAEHIVSGIVNSRFGLDNVGFHLSEKEVTMDYNGVLTKEELGEIERLANRAVFGDIEITAEYPEEERLREMSYRSKLELTENVRIVTIKGIDVCACCAPHVRRTGEIGIIKLKDMMHHRGGVRVRMICGEDALDDYENRYESSVKISNMLSVKQEKIADGVQKLLDSVSSLKAECAAKTRRIAQLKLAGTADADGNICIFEDDADMDLLRILANGASEKCPGLAAALSGDDIGGYRYVIAGKNAANRVNEINKVLSGRGGGRGDIVSGSFRASRTEIEEYFRHMN